METPSSESGDRNARLASLLQDGRELLEESEPVEAHSAFERWVSFVGRWLAPINPALNAQWLGMPYSHLVIGNEKGRSEPVAPWHDQNGVGRRTRNNNRCASRLGDGAHGWKEGDRRQNQRFPEARIKLGFARSEHVFKIGQ